MLEWFQRARKQHVQPLHESHPDIPPELRKNVAGSNAPHGTLYGRMHSAHNPSVLHEGIQAHERLHPSEKDLRVKLRDIGPYVRFDIHDPTKTQKDLKKIVADWHAHTTQH